MSKVRVSSRAAWRACGLTLAVIVGATVVGTAVPAGAAGNPGGVVSKFTDPTIAIPGSIALGPDGALWFTNYNSIGRITTSGVVTNYTDPTISDPEGIVAGPDGALWFTNFQLPGRSIGRITTSGVVTNFSDPRLHTPQGIVSGPDGALWFTDSYGNSIGRITTSGVITTFTDPRIDFPVKIGAGADGALWFTEQHGKGTDTPDTIGRITTAGALSFYTDPKISYPVDITAGPDGALWFTNYGNASIGRITTAGVVSKYTARTITSPEGIAGGPDGALWFTNYGNASIGRISTAGVVSNFTDPSLSTPEGIAAGPDGALWFTGGLANGYVARITTRPFVRMWPKSGPAGSGVNVSGGGFTAGETVTATYKTGLVSPSPPSLSVCVATAAADGTFSCNGTIPTTDAGALGAHKIVAQGSTSLSTAHVSFTLTTVTVGPHITYSSSVAGGQEVITVNGSRFEPFSNDRVDVYDPVAAGFQYGWPTASALGTFTVNVPIPAYACRGNVTIDAIQYAPIYAVANVLTDLGNCISFSALTLKNGWTNAPFGTRNAAAGAFAGIVHLKGAIATTGTNPVAFTLPTSLRPATAVYVPVDLCTATKGRLYIQPSGVVTVQAETSFSHAQCFTSLDGVSFALTAPTALTLQNGWTNGPFGTTTASAAVVSGVVHLKGAIATIGTNPVAFTLPADLRPSTAVYVPVDMCGATNGRLVIGSDGVVTVEAETSFSNAQCFTSLDGVSFALTAPTALTLQNGWTNGPFGTSNAAASLVSGIVHLKGAIATTGTNPVAFTLPAELRPSASVYVTVDMCNATNGRLIIASSGVVTVQAETTFANAQCLTSLDGVSYAPNT